MQLQLEEKNAAAAIFSWREDAVELLRDARASVVAEWHQYGTREQAVDDLAAYLLTAWTQSGETTASLLMISDEEEDEAALLLQKCTASDPRAGQLRLARLVAESAAAEVFADVPARSYDDVLAANEPDLDAETEAKIDAALAWIDAANANLAAQRTAAWHNARTQLFSASTIHKLLSTPAQYNSLIYEKCLAMRQRRRRAAAVVEDTDDDKKVACAAVVASMDISSNMQQQPMEDAGPRPLRYKPRAPDAAPMTRRAAAAENDEAAWTKPVFRRVLDARNWGTKMEPLSAAYYCYRNRSAAGVEPELRTDLGCLEHRVHAFLGASPDGVVVGPRGHPRRGCNVEIKNIVDREITGDPKPEHYAQFQLQMEVCDLLRTDFLETRFCEYEFPEDYFLRQQLRPDLPHGLVLHFAPPGGSGGCCCVWGGDEDDEAAAAAAAPPPPKAEWAYSRPGQALCTREQVDAWIAAERAARSSSSLELDETAYWVLEEYSCVRSDRNREWFATVLPTLAEAWRTVERECESGFEHRAPAAARRAAAAASMWDNEDDEFVVVASAEPAGVVPPPLSTTSSALFENEDIYLPPPPPPSESPPQQQQQQRKKRKRRGGAQEDDDMLLLMAMMGEDE